jgi:hypothetical protein
VTNVSTGLTTSPAITGVATVILLNTAAASAPLKKLIFFISSPYFIRQKI